MYAMKKVVILTGAGMSAESGISTFRDSGGLWEEYRVEDVATIEGYQRNPELVLNFYNERRRQLPLVRPCHGHELVAELEKDFDVTVITQNVDNLHERAGSTKVIHLHGELDKATSTWSPNDPKQIVTLPPDHPDIHIGDTAADGSQLRKPTSLSSSAPASTSIQPPASSNMCRKMLPSTSSTRRMCLGHQGTGSITSKREPQKVWKN